MMKRPCRARGRVQSLKCVFRAGRYTPPPPSYHLPIIYAAYCFKYDEIMQSEFLRVLRSFLFILHSRPCWRIGLTVLPWPPPPDGDISWKYRHRALDETEDLRRSEKIHLSFAFLRVSVAPW